jgi:hypothetical protein
MAFKIRFIFLLLIGLFSFVSATPTGPDFLNITDNESWSGLASGVNVNTSGGIISALNVSATSQNPHWKAFVGSISGEFTLDDSSGSSIYDWSFSSIGGEVYASRNSSTVDWSGIGCASAAEILAEDVALDHTGEDNISSTFSGTNTGTYAVAGININPTDCFASNTYIGNVSQGVSFEEFILHDSVNIVFATNIEDSVVGYDGLTYDFQMIVPENGNSTFVGSTAYYLYLEIN